MGPLLSLEFPSEPSDTVTFRCRRVLTLGDWLKAILFAMLAAFQVYMKRVSERSRDVQITSFCLGGKLLK